MKIGFVFTNFNNSQFTRKAIHSLSLSNNWNESCVVIVDNKSKEIDIESLKDIKKDFPGIHLILNNKNIGYFKGLNIGIQFLKDNFCNLDCIVIGNNDLVFPESFSESIINNSQLFKKYAVISPNLITMDGVHQNPHVINGISNFRKFVWSIYYVNYSLALIIKCISNITNIISDRKDEKQFGIAQTIEQGYGACYILGPLFFKHFDLLWAPTFLMEEEYFLSEQLKKENLELYYEPKIVVYHHDHATFNVISNKKSWEFARDSHNIYRRYVIYYSRKQ